MLNFLLRYVRICSVETLLPSASMARRVASPNGTAGFTAALRFARTARWGRDDTETASAAFALRTRISRRRVAALVAFAFRARFRRLKAAALLGVNRDSTR